MSDPDHISKRIAEAQAILKALGLPPNQQKQMPALTFLALAALTPDMGWQDASNPMIGVSPIMDYVNDHYGVSYRENSRETFRKSAIHYFEAAGVIVKNPDKPERATNSPQTVYQLTDAAVSLVRTFGTSDFDALLATHVNSVGALIDRHASRRTLHTLPLRRNLTQPVTLSPGAHSDLIEAIIREFGPRFTPDGVLIYAGDTGQKWGSYFDEATLAQLGVTIPSTGSKMPDVLIHHEAKGWLVVVEAFDTVGPIDPLRRSQLARMFAASAAPLVYVTAFHSRRAMKGQAAKLAWETEVWIAESPDHLIHYNGDRFLGPYV